MRGSSDTRQPPITVLLVDDHAVVLRGLRFFLETEADIEVVGEAGDGRSALEAVERLRPDVVLMDLVMPGIDGVQATREVVRAYPETKVIVLTSFSEQDRVVPAIQAGAAGTSSRTWRRTPSPRRFGPSTGARRAFTRASRRR